MKRIRPLLTLALALIFIGSISMVIAQTFEYQKGEEAYDQAAELVELPDFTEVPLAALPEDMGLPTDLPAPAEDVSTEELPAEAPKPVYVDPYADALRNMDFSALQEVNDDVLGWILIPGTKISYPVLQGEDNEYYLKRNWKQKRNSTGSIYMECQNSRDFSDFSTILYGHRMSDRSMFGLLKKYAQPDYWKDHPVVYITDASGCRTYEIFAAFEVGVTEQTYRIGEFDDGAKQSFIDFSLENSVIDTGVIPTIYDQILTMSTCTGDGHETRWVVQAVLRGEAPADEADFPSEADIPAPSEAPSPETAAPEPAAQPAIAEEPAPSQDIPRS